MKYTNQTASFKKVLCASVALVVLGFFFGACSPQKHTPPPMYTHTVSVPGETLGLISDWYTGSAQNWRAIAAQNPGLNPNRLRMGDQVYIPESMTRRTDPLTRKYVESATRKGVGAGDTFAKTTTTTSTDTSATNGTTGSSESPAAVVTTTTTQPSDDANAAAVKAAESETATANQAAAKVVEAAKDANVAGSTEEATAQANEAAKQAQAAAEEAAQKASAAAAEAAAKAAEATKNAEAQANDAANVAAANTAVAAPPAADKPKTKEELLKELLEDK